MNKPIYLSSPSISQREEKYVLEALGSNWIAPNGPFNHVFSSELESYYGKKALLTNSGTSAIHLALLSLGVEENDLILCSNFTFAASIFPIRYTKAKPIFIDIEKETWNMSPEFLLEAILAYKKQGKKPKACILVHSYGVSAKIDQIKSICKEYEIPLIEDAAEAMGSNYNMKPLGSLSDFGILSFNGNKIITGSSGGALISNHVKAIEFSRILASQAKEPNKPYFSHELIGYNYSLSNINASIAFAQYQELDKKVEKKREIFQKYLKAFEVNEILVNFPREIEKSFSNRWLSVFTFLDPEKKTNIHFKLKSYNIETRYLWKPMHKQKVFKDCDYFGDRHSEVLFDTGIALPSGVGLLDKEIDFIIEKTLSS